MGVVTLQVAFPEHTMSESTVMCSQGPYLQTVTKYKQQLLLFASSKINSSTNLHRISLQTENRKNVVKQQIRYNKEFIM